MSAERLPPRPPAGIVPCVTSFVFRVRNVPAALYKALGGFATNGVNITKLESNIENGLHGDLLLRRGRRPARGRGPGPCVRRAGLLLGAAGDPGRVPSGPLQGAGGAVGAEGNRPYRRFPCDARPDRIGCRLLAARTQASIQRPRADPMTTSTLSSGVTSSGLTVNAVNQLTILSGATAQALTVNSAGCGAGLWPHQRRCNYV